MRPPPDALGVGRRGRSGRGGSVRGGTGRDAVGRGGVGGSGVTARDRRPRSCPAAPPGLLGSAPGPGPDARSCVRALPPGPGRPNSAARPRPACIDRPAPAWWEGRVGGRLSRGRVSAADGAVRWAYGGARPGGRPTRPSGREMPARAWPGHSGGRGTLTGGLARPFWREDARWGGDWPANREGGGRLPWSPPGHPGPGRPGGKGAEGRGPAGDWSGYPAGRGMPAGEAGPAIRGPAVREGRGPPTGGLARPSGR